MTLFVLLFMKITTYDYVYFIPSYGWIRIRIFFRIRIQQKVSDSFGFGSATLTCSLSFITIQDNIRIPALINEILNSKKYLFIHIIESQDKDWTDIAGTKRQSKNRSSTKTWENEIYM
jgi:hypothetical protein